MERVFNFAPGPSMLPLPVLEQIQKELLCYGSTGMSVMEMSHRSKMYLDIFNQTVADLREVMASPSARLPTSELQPTGFGVLASQWLGPRA